MAEYGARFRNASNVAQIDGVYRNLQLVAKGSDVPDQTSPSSGGFDYPNAWKALNFTGLTNPVMVIRCVDPAYFAGNSTGAGAFAFRLYRPKTASSAIEWWLFDDVKPTSLAPGWGMRVRNKDTNEVVYDTRLPPFRVVDQIAPFTMPTSGTADYSYPAGKKYAYTSAKMAARHTNQGASTVLISREYSFCKATSGGISLSWNVDYVWVGSAGSVPSGQPAPFNSGLTSWLVVDVTNL